MANTSIRMLAAAALVCAAAGAMGAARADVLLVDRVKQEGLRDLPSRGLSMSQVETRFGAPVTKMDPRGGDAPTHPVINRWEYASFVVYFERDKVIDAVVKRATPTELGPKDSH
jgi:hypothetical protein